MSEVLWTPPADVRQTTQVGRFLDHVRDTRGHELSDYDELFAWSVADLEGFWGSLWEFFGVQASTPYERVLGSREMPGAEWFTGARLNYAEHMLGREEDLGVRGRHGDLADPRAVRADLRRPARAGGAPRGPGCSGWGWGRATAWWPTCRTSRRR